MTPPDSTQGPLPPAPEPDKSSVDLALHVISTERAALTHVENVYRNDALARHSMAMSVTQIARSCSEYGKLVVIGVGKSGKIGEKLVATFNSLGATAVFMSPSEALHGDLGMVRPSDVVLMITFSGRTSELLHVLPHLSPYIPLVLLTGHTVPATCPIIAKHEYSILLPAPIHEPEKQSFGLSAPTTSTTVALAVGDALALSVAARMHNQPGRSPADVFQAYHPGGAIGAATVEEKSATPCLNDLATQVHNVPIAEAQHASILLGLDILKSAIRSPGGWVRTNEYHIIGPRQIHKLVDMSQPVSDLVEQNIVREKGDWISVLGTCSVDEAKQWIIKMRSEPRGKSFLHEGTILGIVDKHNEVSGVVEIEDVVGDEWIWN